MIHKYLMLKNLTVAPTRDHKLSYMTQHLLNYSIKEYFLSKITFNIVTILTIIAVLINTINCPSRMHYYFYIKLLFTLLLFTHFCPIAFKISHSQNDTEIRNCSTYQKTLWIFITSIITNFHICYTLL